MTTDGPGGVQSDSLPYCPDVDGDGVADPVAPPPPPTHAEVVASVCPGVPPAVLGHSPHEYGITGMETWFWSAGDVGSRSGSGVIRGYPVECALTAVQFDVDTGDGHAATYGHSRRYASADPGSESPSTPARHLWEVAGTYTVTHTVTWSRVSSVGADQTARSTSTNYPVREIVVGPTTAARP